MSESKIDSIVEDLKSEEERLKNDLADLKKQAQAVARELKTVQSGLASLAGKAAATRKRSAGKKRGSQEVPLEAPLEAPPEAPLAVNIEPQSEMTLESFP